MLPAPATIAVRMGVGEYSKELPGILFVLMVFEVETFIVIRLSHLSSVMETLS